jgi:hypothetical protein
MEPRARKEQTPRVRRAEPSGKAHDPGICKASTVDATGCTEAGEALAGICPPGRNVIASQSQYAAAPYRKPDQIINLWLGELISRLRMRHRPNANVVFKTKPAKAVTILSKRSGFIAPLHS